MGAPISSGTYPTQAMIVAPCSVSSLASIASGVTTTLLHRAADVHLKERRPLVLVPREAPLSAIHLENMLKLARLGVTILPPSPASTCARRAWTRWWTSSWDALGRGRHPRGTAPGATLRPRARSPRPRAVVKARRTGPARLCSFARRWEPPTL